jgi:hypothetical protein
MTPSNWLNNSVISFLESSILLGEDFDKKYCREKSSAWLKEARPKNKMIPNKKIFRYPISFLRYPLTPAYRQAGYPFPARREGDLL